MPQAMNTLTRRHLAAAGLPDALVAYRFAYAVADRLPTAWV
jgi:hypothetical protein